MPNRLAKSHSPYLRQHADNPVDWYEWGPEAFDLARSQNKPVFLSIGYSSCHWCHVMAHESFEDEDVAQVLNLEFISVKVDREERPDVDDTYMTAVQISSGRGGWPMSVFLTPDRKPFFAGTYFPKRDQGGYPGFLTLAMKVAELWRARREELEKEADELSKAVQEMLSREAPDENGSLDISALKGCVQSAIADSDPEYGGPRGAPKFPPHSQLELLLAYAKSPLCDPAIARQAEEAAIHTLLQICLGGIHDHVGGGFHRYSTDHRWLLPHFEKTLYDNALLLGNLSVAGRLASGSILSFLLAAASRTADWLEGEMRTPSGLYGSALDADSEGEEGKFYVWSRNEVEAVLGDGAGPFIEAFGIESEGNFEDEATHRRTGANVLHLREPSLVYERELREIYAARSKRIRPGFDDKALIAWNGLAIKALCLAGRDGRAKELADTILAFEGKHGRLPHQVSGDEPMGDAFLDGYAYFCQGLLNLSASDPSYRVHAMRLAEIMKAKFWDQRQGGFWFTSNSHEVLLGRSKPGFDSPTPSPNGVAAACLAALGDFGHCKQVLTSLGGWMRSLPNATEALHLGLLRLLEHGQQSGMSTPRPPVGAEFGNIRREGLHVRGHVKVSIAQGFHINTNEPEMKWLVPTRLFVEGKDIAVNYPLGKGGRWTGSIVIPFSFDTTSDEVHLTLEYQACNEQDCLKPDQLVLPIRLKT